MSSSDKSKKAPSASLGQLRLLAIRYPFLRWFLLFLAISIVLSPLDIIPDFSPVIGWFDDIIAAIFLIKEAINLFRGPQNLKDK